LKLSKQKFIYKNFNVNDVINVSVSKLDSLDKSSTKFATPITLRSSKHSDFNANSI